MGPELPEIAAEGNLAGQRIVAHLRGAADLNAYLLALGE